MGRGHRGQLLVAAGVVLVVVGAFAVLVSRGVRDTDSIRDAAPQLLEVSSVRDAVTDEFARSIAALYSPSELSAATLDSAAERMVSNGYVIDDFQAALDTAHRGWSAGAPLEVQLDPSIATQTALTALRDVDPAAAGAFPRGGVVAPGPVLLPIDVTVTRLADVQAPALLAIAGGLVLIAVGAIIDRDRSRTLKNLARGLCTASLLALLAAFVLPLGVLRDMTPVVGVVGAIARQNTTLLLVLAVVTVVVGLSLHASADRIVTEVSRKVRSARSPRNAAPVSSGAKLARRSADRTRSEAIDAFFGERAAVAEADRSTEDSPDEIVLDDEIQLPVAADSAAGSDEDEESVERDGGDESDTPPPATPLTPEQERAEALAAERKEALERIDGTRSGYRTHMKR